MCPRTVGNVMNSVGTASGMAIGPLLNGYYKAGKEESAKYLIFILQIAFFLLTFGLCIWMKEIFAFLIRNENLAQMYYLGIIIVMAYNYCPMYFGVNAKLMFREKTNVIWKVTLVAGIINVILNLSLIPIIGFEVAAVTTFLAYMFMGYAGYFFKAFKEVNSVTYYPFLWFILTILLTIIAYYAVELSSLIIKIGITLGILAAGLIFIWKYNKLVIENGGREN